MMVMTSLADEPSANTGFPQKMTNHNTKLSIEPSQEAISTFTRRRSRHRTRRAGNTTNTSRSFAMVAAASCVFYSCVGVLFFTDAIRPSLRPATTGNRNTGSLFTPIKQPPTPPSRGLRRLWYRRSDEDDGTTTTATRRRRIPTALRRGVRINGNNNVIRLKPEKDARINKISPEESTLADELSLLLDSIETLATEVEGSNSFPPTSTGGLKKNKKKTASASSDPANRGVQTVHQLREALLDQGQLLKDVTLAEDVQLLVNATTEQLLNHDVVELMVQRFRTGSTPGNRAPDDTASLALSIEGGGMRGAVSAGMASAIACLGLCDTFDTVYGSSAGSVIGAYMISRQMCMDVYVDILPAAKRTFVCTKRIVSALAFSAVDMFFSRRQRRRDRPSNQKIQHIHGNSDTLPKEKLEAFADRPFKSRFPAPGMNISFVLDGIMGDEHGIRPLDMESFRRNDKKQPLRVASSYAKDGKLHSKCFGTEHFFHDERSALREDGVREGLFACLEPSMTVPGATGPPVRLGTHDSDEVLPYFDAFCFEPVPYRSAVEEGATHVLALCSRPEGFEPKTKPGVYEQAITPLYFKSHGLPEVAEFFSKGGQQYIYLEDYMTLEEGKIAGVNKAGPIAVPPPTMLYGVEKDHINQELSAQRDEKWKKAHLLPLKVPLGTPELAVLEQDKDAVREAVREGFAAAFDLLAPAIGLNTHHELTGADIAALIFPENPGMLDEIILAEQRRVGGDKITRKRKTPTSQNSPNQSKDDSPSGRRRQIRLRRDRFLRNARHALRVVAKNKSQRRTSAASVGDEVVTPSARELSLAGGDAKLTRSLDEQEKARYLLDLLPGIQSGRMSQLAMNLHFVASKPRASAESPEESILKP